MQGASTHDCQPTSWGSDALYSVPPAIVTQLALPASGWYSKAMQLVRASHLLPQPAIVPSKLVSYLHPSSPWAAVVARLSDDG